MFWRKKQPPQNVAQQAAQSPRTRFSPLSAFTYEAKPQPDGIGAQRYAYENLGLTEFSPIGAATANRGAIRPLQPGTLFVMQSVYQQGIGGLVTGGIYGAPLIDPSIPLEQQFSTG